MEFENLSQIVQIKEAHLDTETGVLDGINGLVGGTPLIQIKLEYRGRNLTIFAKAEFLNLTGSIKDRMALGILHQATASGELSPRQEIVEVTSGNAGIALAALGRSMGHKVTIFMPDWMSLERQNLLRSFGANLRLVSREEGGFLGAIEMSEDHAALHGSFLARQFANPANVEAHRLGTASELLTQLAALGRSPDGFVAGVGTGGTVMGIARAFAEAGLTACVHPVEPAESPTLSTGYKTGQHRIQGISDDFIPPIVQLSELKAPIAISDSCAIRMAQRLSTELGLGVGISSGANFLAALELLEGMPDDATVATVFCDNSLRYLTTDFGRPERALANSRVNDITFTSLSVIRGHFTGQLKSGNSGCYALGRQRIALST